jgi:hypothetical protein
MRGTTHDQGLYSFEDDQSVYSCVQSTLSHFSKHSVHTASLPEVGLSNIKPSAQKRIPSPRSKGTHSTTTFS